MSRGCCYRSNERVCTNWDCVAAMRWHVHDCCIRCAMRSRVCMCGLNGCKCSGMLKGVRCHVWPQGRLWEMLPGSFSFDLKWVWSLGSRLSRLWLFWRKRGSRRLSTRTVAQFQGLGLTFYLRHHHTSSQKNLGGVLLACDHGTLG